MAAERPPSKEPGRRRPAGKGASRKAQSDDKSSYGNPSGDSEATETGEWVAKGVDLNPAELHAQHVRQRLAGGRQATSEAYADARQQWRRLPGAASASAADLGAPPPAQPGDDDSPDNPCDEQEQGR